MRERGLKRISKEGAAERAKHTAGKEFVEFFSHLLFNTQTCRQRDVVRNAKEALWEEYKLLFTVWEGDVELHDRAGTILNDLPAKAAKSLEKLKRYEEALEFYAVESNHTKVHYIGDEYRCVGTAMQNDKGRRAREALGKDEIVVLVKKIEWISVEDDMPDDGTRVLGFIPKTAIEDRHEVIITYFYADNITTKDVDLTHWMPLPESPKEK